MNKSTILIIVYIAGLVFGALVLDLWSANTSPKALIGIIWTAFLLVGLFLVEKMRDNKFFIYLSFITLFISKVSIANSEIIELSSCDNFKDGFLKNEYILDLEKLTMTRNYVFNEKTYQRYRITDLSTKKKNTIESFIYIEGKNILTDRMGYPQFFTQLLFKKDSKDIFIKTVINNEEGITKISSCKNLERYKKES